ncbi:MAG: hypothetical protein N2Z22_07280, partial [Turneriella sp.]|nr:hypothetical protein [Turneriella sp.]
YMTAYALWGLSEAQKAGIAVDKKALQRGQKYLLKELPKLPEPTSDYERNRRLFSELVALKLDPKSQSEIIRRRWEKMAIASLHDPYSLALLLEGAALMGAETLKTAALNRLKALKKSEPAGSYFTQPQPVWGFWYSDREEMTARVLLALQAAGENSTIPQRELVAYLLAQKKQPHWRNTRVSALVAKALLAWALAAGEKAQAQRIVLRTGKSERVVDWDPRRNTITELRQDFRIAEQSARVSISRSGSGFFLARAEWRHYLETPLPPERQNPFRLSRRFYRVERNEGKYRIGAPSYQFRAGDIVMAELELRTPRGAEYLLIEDMLPAGFEPLADAELSSLGEIQSSGYENLPSALTRLDDRVALAKTFVEPDRFAPRAFYRARFPGHYQSMPAQGGWMYYPESFVFSTKDAITIRD